MTTFKPHARWLVTMLCLFAILFASAGLPQTVLAASTFTVNDNRDLGDTNLLDPTCDVAPGTEGSQCTLRAALQQANSTGGTTTITFSEAMTISPATPLPVVSGGAVGKIILSGGLQDIFLDGSSLTPGSGSIGLELIGNASVIQGIAIRDFSYGVKISGDYNTVGVNDNDETSANEACTFVSNNESADPNLLEAAIYITSEGSGNTIAGNYIGVTSVGTLSSNENGIIVEGDNNIIGTDGDGKIDADEWNLISGNVDYGVYIHGSTTLPQPDGNRVAGNFIGVNVARTAALCNGKSGVRVFRSGASNIVGTNGDGNGDSAERNVISGNGDYGVEVDNDKGATRIAGNIIGANVNGTNAIANSDGGVAIKFSQSCTVGTNGDGISDNLERNIISGNGKEGVYLQEVINSRVSGNWIGVQLDDGNALPNATHGIWVDSSYNNVIGTNADGVSDNLERNVISGNTHKGIMIWCVGDNVSGNQIAGNYIGTWATGDLALPNGSDGIYIAECTAPNTVGGALAVQRNVVSGNTGSGIHLEGSSSILVQNNWIGKGTDPGSQPWPVGNQGQAGISIHEYSTADRPANHNTITGNVIANNAGDGVQIGADNTDLSSGNLLENNSIYDNTGMAIDLGNQGPTNIDQEDMDTGPNGLQNYPEFSPANIVYDGLTLKIPTTFHSTANSSFDLWYYHSKECDSGVPGDANVLSLIGKITIHTDAAGDSIPASFNAEFPAVVITQNNYVKVLAVNADTGDTSEFSACKPFTGAPPAIHRVYLPLLRR